jgi:hypothetical protein
MENALALCGFNAQTIRYLVNQGFATPGDLLLATDAALNSIATLVARNPPRNMPQVNMPFMALKNVKGLCFWADKRKRTGLDANAGDFTQEDIISFTAKCHGYNFDNSMLKTIFCKCKYISQVCFQPICCLKNNVVDNEGI